MIDADDEIPDAVWTHFETSPLHADVTTFRASTIEADGREKLRGKTDTAHALDDRTARMKEYYSFRNLFAVWNKIYRTSVLQRAFEPLMSLHPVRYGEDLLINAIAFWFAKSHEHREVVAYHYNQHEKQLTSTRGIEADLQRAWDHHAVMTFLDRFHNDHNDGIDQISAAFNFRRFHATSRMIREIIDNETIDEVAGANPHLAAFYPWAAEIARLHNRITHLEKS